MATMVQMQKKIAWLHRYPEDQIHETNQAFPYLKENVDVISFKKYNRKSKLHLFKVLLWMVYAPLRVMWRGYDVIYCDDSIPFYPILIKLVCPRTKLVLRLGDFHLMYYCTGWVYNVIHLVEYIGWVCATHIICISDAMERQLNEEGVIWTSVVNDPVNPNNYPRGKHESNGSVMFHGVLTKNKGLLALVRAAWQLPNVQFYIVGDGPDKRRLKLLSPMNIHYTGWIPFHKVHNYIERCSVGVAMRSKNRGNEFVVTSPYLQYGIMGKPCLVSKREVFENYPWQFVNTEDLVDKIKYLLEHSVEEGYKLRQEILKNHKAEDKAEEIWQILTQA
jgi:glycosyltransferase involved in cell wall biosynthesis